MFIEESDLAIERVRDNNIGGIYFVSASEVINNCGLKMIPIARHSGGNFISLARQKNICNVANKNMSDLDNSFEIEVSQTLKYPLIRRLFIIIEINSPIDEEIGEAYKNLLLTKQGQGLIAKAGFIPIRSLD